MFYGSLAIYRFGALAELSREADSGWDRPRGSKLVADFNQQRKAILRRNEYQSAIDRIREEAETMFGQATYGNNDLLQDNVGEALWTGQPEDLGDDIFLMPPPLKKRERDLLGPSVHLVGVLPAERMQCRIDKTWWAIRVRASVTACALETPNGYPKLWWTFEGVPVRPDTGDRLSGSGMRSFFNYTSRIEPEITNALCTSYFGALGEVLEMDGTPDHTLGDERLRLRFADSDDTCISELIDALRFHSLTIDDIKASSSEILAPAKKGVEVFKQFVGAANVGSFEPPVKVELATSDLDDLHVEVEGVETVAIRSHDDAKETTAIAGVAQRPSLLTPWDEFGSNQQITVTENDEPQVRAKSASRRITRKLAGREAIQLELRRRAASKAAPVSTS